MSDYSATIRWQRAEHETFSDNQYSRGHQWQFDGGVSVPASASPHVVPLPYAVEENVDPEEAFIAAISSCHMLTFLGIAAKRRYVIDSYVDEAIGIMEEDDKGRTSVTKVTLRPNIIFSGSKQPDYAQLEKMHHLAHQHCFIANSVKTEIVTEILTA
ncbi:MULTISPECIES: OsmC family protein [Vibrio]|uniref:OsmC family protein n=1 Tax=Vibrio TaxID=662 RepID=UPI001EFC367A|nr:MULTISPECIES: OsmC family protein [Vibrio]MCG9677555.1 OsmC family protein [Vibrio sp. Isolate24]USD35052.1 OsmC family protein [Vibrio sp. SCSIO 43186]USD48117.1 OsmC family protein [Vibrio sp. SCSIO 43145]USD72177.1 OsmC family protein [Vibrio sp. SCSIO 43139]USD97849.1 peroxiredoxin [Vibrio coralliilyticus]